VRSASTIYREEEGERKEKVISLVMVIQPSGIEYTGGTGSEQSLDTNMLGEVTGTTHF